MISVLTACGGGGGSGSGDGGPSNPAATSAVIRAAALSTAGSGNATVQAPLGSTLTLDGSGSSGQGGVTSYLWTVSARPAGSTASLQNPSGAVATFAPDVVGSYQFTLQVGAGGSTASAVLPVTVTAAVPVVSVATVISFNAPVTNLPAQSVSLGSVVTLDGAGSTDAAGGPVTLSWTLLSAPTGSHAGLTSIGSTGRFTPDLAGRFQVRVRGTALSGLYADAVYTFDVASTAPTVVVATSISTVGTTSSLSAAVGNLVSLDGAASSVPSGNADGTWTIQTKPGGSSLAQLTSVSATAVSFVPDVAGAYTLQYTLIDRASGATSFHRVQVNVVVGPTAVVSAGSAPVAQTGGPSYVGAVGAPITLRGGASFDPAGSSLSFIWVLDTRPAGSSAALTGASSANAVFTPDRDGQYGATLRVTNSAGLSAVSTVSVYVGNYPPVVVVDRSQQMVLLGNPVSASAAGSYSQNNGTLSYSWALDTRPTGSNANLGTTNTAAISFTPDLAGSYFASVTVTDGTVSSVSGVSIVVLAASSGTVPLTYQPLLTRFSRSQNKVVIVSTNPNALHLVDPSAGTDLAIALPAAVKSLSISADGLLAGVLHEGNVSLVDLVAARLLHTSATGGSHTEVFTANSGVVFVTGQSGGQWVTPPMVALNGRTGASIGTGGGFASIYGVTRGVLAETAGRLFTLSEGLSPSQIYWTGVNTATGAFTGSNGGSPYWGDYSMANPMWLSADQSLLFTASGNYFRTADLVYAGNLGGAMLSVSHSASATEAVALASNASYGTPTQYPDVLKRFTGSQLFAAADVRLPLLAGLQTYGLAVFHASDDRRVLVVQTGGAGVQASGLQYFVLLR